MKTRALIITPNLASGQEQSSFLVNNGIDAEVVDNGKDAQIILSKSSFLYIFLDIETTNHHWLEVFRYIQTRFTNSNLFLISREQHLFNELPESVLRKLDDKMLVAPTGKDLLLSIKALSKIKTWTPAVNPDQSREPAQEATIGDSEFTRIKIEELLYDVLAILDFYIRLGKDRYVKIIHKGDLPTQQQIEKYAKGGSNFLYFLTKDRADFISYQNNVASKMISDNSQDSGRIVKTLKTLTDKYIEEVFVEGLQPALISEGKLVCENMYNLTQRDSDLKPLMKSLEEFSPTVYSHSFLVCFFSTIICKNLNWVGSTTQEALSLAALFHDVGLMQLPDTIKDKNQKFLTKDEFLIFRQHPHLGKDALANMSIISTMTKEIVLQHHETLDGKGFPYGLTGLKIYPLAKIVGLADAFTDLLLEKGVPPRDGMKEFLGTRENLLKFDSELVKSLVKGFTSNKQH